MYSKRILSLILSTLLIFSPVSAFANENTPASKTMPYGYVPLINIAQICGFSVSLQDSSATLHFDGSNLLFTSGEEIAYLNKAPVNLTSSPVIINDIFYVNYDDVSFMLGDKGDFPVARKTAITNAYYYMDLYKIPSVTMAIVDAETGYSWNLALGYKNIEENQIPDENTIYGVGSISKVFTAMAVMLLVEKGKLDLDQSVYHYIPEIKTKPHPVYGGSFKDITLRMLLAHVSGLPGDRFDNFYTTNYTDKDYINSFIKYLNEEYLDMEPGFRFNYANNGYTLLGIILSRAAGYSNDYEGFIKYTTDNIINKMGLPSTTFTVNEKIRKNLAGSYVNSALPKTSFLHINALAAGGLLSTGKDMGRFMSFILGHGSFGGETVLSSNSVSAMANPSGYDTSLNPNLEIGLGLYTSQYGNLVMTGHGGTTEHFHSDFKMSLHNKIGVFVGANSSSAILAPGNLSALILNSAVIEKTGIENNITNGIIARNAEISESDINKLTGVYTGIGVVEGAEDSQIFIPSINTYFQYKADGSFYNKNLGSLYFETIKGIDVIKLKTGGTFNIIGERIEPAPCYELLDFVGIYKPTSPGDFEKPILSSIEIKLDDEGRGSLSFTASDGQKSNYAFLGYIRDGMYYILGNSRNHGKVAKFKYFGGTRYLEIFGDKFYSPSGKI